MRPPALWEDATTPNRVMWMIPVSLFLHACLLIAVFVAGWLVPKRTPPPPVYQVTLVAPILKGTPGGGAAAAAIKPPPGTATTTPPPDVKPAATPAAVKLPAPDAMSTQTSKTESKADALARIKKEALLRRLAEADASRHAKTSDTPAPNATPMAVNPDTSAKPGKGSGEGTGNGGLEYGVWDGLPGSASYEAQIQTIVTRNWSPFTAGLDKNPLECVIHVVIGFDGKIMTKEIEVSSGNASFDNSALAALKASDPLPPPPLELKAFLAHNGKSLHFDSRQKVATK